MATDNTRIAKNTLFMYFRMFLVMGVSLLTARVTLRTLGAVDYGLNAVLGGIVAMLLSVVPYQGILRLSLDVGI